MLKHSFKHDFMLNSDPDMQSLRTEVPASSGAAAAPASEVAKEFGQAQEASSDLATPARQEETSEPVPTTVSAAHSQHPGVPEEGSEMTPSPRGRVFKVLGCSSS